MAISRAVVHGATVVMFFRYVAVTWNSAMLRERVMNMNGYLEDGFRRNDAVERPARAISQLLLSSAHLLNYVRVVVYHHHKKLYPSPVILDFASVVRRSLHVIKVPTTRTFKRRSIAIQIPPRQMDVYRYGCRSADHWELAHGSRLNESSPD